MLAYLLIGLQEAKEREILDEITKYSEVKEAHVLFGEWDILAKLEIESADALGTFIMEKIRTIPEVKVTSTLIVAK